MTNSKIEIGPLRRGQITGAWFDPHDDQDRHGNPNALTLDRGASSLSQGCAAQTCLVGIRRFDGAPPRVTAFDLPQLEEAATG